MLLAHHWGNGRRKELCPGPGRQMPESQWQPASLLNVCASFRPLLRPGGVVGLGSITAVVENIYGSLSPSGLFFFLKNKALVSKMPKAWRGVGGRSG